MRLTASSSTSLVAIMICCSIRFFVVVAMEAKFLKYGPQVEDVEILIRVKDLTICMRGKHLIIIPLGIPTVIISHNLLML